MRDWRGMQRRAGAGAHASRGPCPIGGGRERQGKRKTWAGSGIPGGLLATVVRLRGEHLHFISPKKGTFTGILASVWTLTAALSLSFDVVVAPNFCRVYQ